MIIDNGVRDVFLIFVIVEVCLKLYLREMKVDKGEMLYGFRLGCVIILVLIGGDFLEIMEYVGWV